MDGSWSTGEGPDHWAGNTWLGMADDYLVLTDFENMPADVKMAAEAAEAKIKGGYNIFTGPYNDNEGNVILRAGEAYNDGNLWNDMNYYVEGVNGKIPG